MDFICLEMIEIWLIKTLLISWLHSIQSLRQLKAKENILSIRKNCWNYEILYIIKMLQFFFLIFLNEHIIFFFYFENVYKAWAFVFSLQKVAKPFILKWTIKSTGLRSQEICWMKRRLHCWMPTQHIKTISYLNMFCFHAHYIFVKQFRYNGVESTRFSHRIYELPYSKWPSDIS